VAAIVIVFPLGLTVFPKPFSWISGATSRGEEDIEKEKEEKKKKKKKDGRIPLPKINVWLRPWVPLFGTAHLCKHPAYTVSSPNRFFGETETCIYAH